jgi:hypothetical protein
MLSRIRFCNNFSQQKQYIAATLLTTRINHIGTGRMSTLASDLGQIRAPLAELTAILAVVAG